MALGILAEALLRIEHKVDLILNRLGFLDPTPDKQLHFIGNQCPVCKQVIDYQVDITHNVVIRKCGCKTGKQPSIIPLVPVPGAPNGNTPPTGRTFPAAPDASGSPPENSPRRKSR